MSVRNFLIKYMFLVLVIVLVSGNSMAVLHAQENGQTTQDTMAVRSLEDMEEFANALHAQWDAQSGQLILQEDVP